MRTLLLLRHGKSDWDAAAADDHDRPLAKRGRKAAVLMGEVLARIDERPDRVYTSSAVRAHDTVRRAARAGGWSCPIEVRERLYHATPADVIAVLREADVGDGRILVAGHEPTGSMVAGALIGGASLRIPTAAMARIDLEIEDWVETGPGRGTLAWLLTPRLVADLLSGDGVS